MLPSALTCTGWASPDPQDCTKPSSSMFCTLLVPASETAPGWTYPPDDLRVLLCVCVCVCACVCACACVCVRACLYY
jgi:hypothetical protein